MREGAATWPLPSPRSGLLCTAAHKFKLGKLTTGAPACTSTSRISRLRCFHRPGTDTSFACRSAALSLRASAKLPPPCFSLGGAAGAAAVADMMLGWLVTLGELQTCCRRASGEVRQRWPRGQQRRRGRRRRASGQKRLHRSQARSLQDRSQGEGSPLRLLAGVAGGPVRWRRLRLLPIARCWVRQ